VILFRLILLRMREMLQTNVAEATNKNILFFNNIFPKIVPFVR